MSENKIFLVSFFVKRILDLKKKHDSHKTQNECDTKFNNAKLFTFDFSTDVIS